MIKNIFISLLIIGFLIAIGFISTLDDPKGIGRGILIILGFIIFLIIGSITTILVIKKRMNIKNILFLTSLFANLFCVTVFISDFDSLYQIIMVLIIPTILIICQLGLLTNRIILKNNRQ